MTSKVNMKREPTPFSVAAEASSEKSFFSTRLTLQTLVMTGTWVLERVLKAVRCIALKVDILFSIKGKNQFNTSNML